jgi:hypothetical protein
MPSYEPRFRSWYSYDFCSLFGHFVSFKFAHIPSLVVLSGGVLCFWGSFLWSFGLFLVFLGIFLVFLELSLSCGLLGAETRA